MKQSLKRITFMTIALVLIISVMSVMSLAATDVSDDRTKITFEKQFAVDHWNSITFPDIVFKFTIEAGEAVAATGTTQAIHAGVGSPTVSSVTFTNTEITAASGHPSENVTIDFSGVTFPTTGVYRYVIKEVKSTGIAGLDDAVVFDQDRDGVRVLDVMVTQDASGQNKVEAAVMINADSEGNPDTSDKINFFKNHLVTNDLGVKKTVSGNGADKNEPFTITVTLTNCPKSGTFDIVKKDQSGGYTTTTQAYDASGTTTVEVELKHNEEAVLHGLPKSVHYNVTENLTQAHRDEGYVDPTMGGVNDAEMTVNREVTITNTKTVNTPTGLFMDYAPYIALVVVALGAAILFLRKRSTREDR